jgi:hypothetical protein
MLHNSLFRDKWNGQIKMVLSVTDSSSNRNDKIANAARILEKSVDRRKVFMAIYSGKKRKTVKEIMAITAMSRVRVNQEAKKLASEDIVERSGSREIVYEKIDFYNHNRAKILSLANNKDKLNQFPTKTNPQKQARIVTAKYPKKLIDYKYISIDDIDSFSKTRKVTATHLEQLDYESTIKKAMQKIIGEDGKFIDWGGETDDLYSTRLIMNGKRYRVAFALKGKATTGVLTPKKMGKNSDQIQRLFQSAADVFFVLYQGQIDESVVHQMQHFAIAKSVMEEKRVYFGVIDGQDMVRLRTAYPAAFS